MRDGSEYTGRFADGMIPELGGLPSSIGEFVEIGNEFLNEGKLEEAAKVYVLGLQLQPENLNLLAGDMLLAQIQGDNVRRRTRLEAILPLLKPYTHERGYIYALLMFYGWLLEPQKSWNGVLETIDGLNMDKGVGVSFLNLDFGWRFFIDTDIILPEELPEKERRAAEAFIVFFEGKISRKELGARLGQVEE